VLLHLLERRRPVLVEQREQAPFADDARAHLRLHVLADDVEPDVGEDQIPDVLPKLPPVDDLDRRDPQPFLPALRGVGVVAALHGAADVGLVTLCRGPGDEPTVMEDRLVDRDVVELVSQGEDVVVEDHVPLVEVVAEVVANVLAHRGQREGEDRQVLRLLEHPPFGVVEPRHEVLRLAEDR